MDELFSLLQIKRHHEAGDFDVIIVDCAPTGETLRLLSFPDVARWWLDKVLPWERRLVAAARPVRPHLPRRAAARATTSSPTSSASSGNLIAMNEILRDREHTSIRLVMNPDRMVIREAQRTFTYLNLYGYLTDAVVVNRVFPDGASTTPTSAPGASAAPSSSSSSARASPRSRCCSPATSRRRSSAPRCSTGSAPSCSGTARRPDPKRHARRARPADQLRDGLTILSIPVPFADRYELELRRSARS